MLNYIKFGIAACVGIGVLILILTSVMPTLTNYSVVNESIVFAAPDTVVAPANHPMYTAAPYVPVLYVSGGALVTNYTVTAEGFNIGADISPDTYLGSYTYYKKAWIGGKDYNWMVGLVVLIGAAAAILKFLGYL